MFVLTLVQDFFFASVHTGEASRNVIDHCLQAFNAMGLPKLIKTDNGPSYISNNFTSFCKEFGIKHKTGVPYNPMGQGIVERAHHTLIKWLLKTKQGQLYPQKAHLAFFLFVLIFCKLMLKVSLQQIATGIQLLPVLMPWLNGGTH
jgi:transposase InsO family protein